MLRKVDFTLSLLCLVLSAVVWIVASGYDPMPSQFPKQLALVFAILSGALLLATVLRPSPAQTTWDELMKCFRAPIVLVAGMAGYVLILSRVGFTLSSILLMVFVSRALGYPRLARLVLVATVTSLVLYAVFALVLNVPLPEPFFADD